MSNDKPEVSVDLDDPHAESFLAIVRYKRHEGALGVQVAVDQTVTATLKVCLENPDVYRAVFQQALKELPSLDRQYLREVLGCKEMHELPFHFLYNKILHTERLEQQVPAHERK